MCALKPFNKMDSIEADNAETAVKAICASIRADKRSLLREIFVRDLGLVEECAHLKHLLDYRPDLLLELLGTRDGRYDISYAILNMWRYDIVPARTFVAHYKEKFILDIDSEVLSDESYREFMLMLLDIGPVLDIRVQVRCSTQLPPSSFCEVALFCLKLRRARGISGVSY